MSESNPPQSASDDKQQKRFSGLQVLGIVLAVMVVTAGLTGFIVWRYLFPSPFTAVELTPPEQQVLDRKVEALGIELETRSVPSASPDALEPEAYSEDNARRQVEFSERELNALLATNTDWANRLAIDLSQDLASAKLLIPLDPDFPLLGGKTLRVNAGVELAFRQGRPVAILRGVSVMGVPLPNAWLGNLKNVDLIGEFGADPGFWNAFAAGIEFIEVRDSRLSVKLKE
ncbi:MAG: hypothetical protein QNJ40_11865 [Xanthomonadales bacterium]|nr:hypothetical protein [Xanthomonadales bacterium]